MSDVFWVQLFGFLALIITPLLTIWVKDRADERRKKELSGELAINTAETVSGKNEVVAKFDSATQRADEATREAQAAGSSAKLAARAAVEAHLVNNRAAAEALKETVAIKETVTKSAALLEDRLNGGPGGLHETNQRIINLEAGIDTVRESYIDLKEIVEANSKRLTAMESGLTKIEQEMRHTELNTDRILEILTSPVGDKPN